MTTPTPAVRLAARDYPADSKPIIDQKWRNLLFLDWEYDPSTIQQTLPKGLTVDTFQNRAHVSIVVFGMESIKPKFFPFLPVIASMLEVNVRTYVYDQAGVPGVWFYSLYANQSFAVDMAKQFFSLPYLLANITSTTDDESQSTVLCQPEGGQFQSTFVYKAEKATFTADPESLEFFLTERYALFSKQGNSIALGRIHHEPYPLTRVGVSQWDTQLLEVNGLVNLNRAPDHAIFSPGVDVEVFMLKDGAEKV